MNCINDNQIWFIIDLSLVQTNSNDNGDFRKKCVTVRLENGAEFY